MSMTLKIAGNIHPKVVELDGPIDTPNCWMSTNTEDMAMKCICLTGDKVGPKLKLLKKLSKIN